MGHASWAEDVSNECEIQLSTVNWQQGYPFRSLLQAELQALLPYFAGELECPVSDLTVAAVGISAGFSELKKRVTRLQRWPLPGYMTIVTGQNFVLPAHTDCWRMEITTSSWSCPFFLVHQAADYHQYTLVLPRSFSYRLLRHLMVRRSPSPPLILPREMYQTLQDAIFGFLRRLPEIRRLGGRTQKGLLLTGPPGNGKTLFLREVQKRWPTATPHMRYGVGSRDVQVVTAAGLEKAFAHNELAQLFEARLVVLDDVDISFFSRRGAHADKACDLLSAMDHGNDVGSIRLIATNEPTHSFDRAFLRPGRIDQVFHFGPPDYTERQRFFDSWDSSILHPQEREALEEIIGNDRPSYAELGAVRSALIDSYLRGEKRPLATTMLRELYQNRSLAMAIHAPKVGFGQEDL